MRHYITVFEGNEKVQTYLLNILPSFATGKITVGRLATNDIVLPYQSVSRSHAVIQLRGDVVDIIDAGSLNKLRVGGVAYERIRLADGLAVTIGTSENMISLKYTAEKDPEPEKAEPRVTTTDGGTAVFDMSALHKQKPEAVDTKQAVKKEIPGKQPATEEFDDVWSPMPKGSAHKVTPVPPVNAQKNENTEKNTAEKPAQKQNLHKTDVSPDNKPVKKITPSFIGRRFIAFMADFVICAFMVVGAAFLMLITLNKISDIKVIALFSFIVAVAVSWIYYTLGESGESGATLGKMALGLKVVDAKTGENIDVKTATKRFFAKALSALILFIGFLPIFGRKQTFHDYISGTKVIKNN